MQKPFRWNTAPLEFILLQFAHWMETAIQVMKPIHTSIQDLTQSHECFYTEPESPPK